MNPLTILWALVAAGVVGGVTASLKSAASTNRFPGQLVNGQLYRLWGRTSGTWLDTARTNSPPGSSQVIIQNLLTGKIQTDGFTNTLLVTQDPTDNTVWTFLTHWGGKTGAPATDDPELTLYQIEPVQSPPVSITAPQPTPPADLDFGLDAQTVTAVTYALSSDADPQHLEGFAVSLDGDYPISAQLLHTKAKLTGLGNMEPDAPPVSGRLLRSMNAIGKKLRWTRPVPSHGTPPRSGLDLNPVDLAEDAVSAISDVVTSAVNDIVKAVPGAQWLADAVNTSTGWVADQMKAFANTGVGSAVLTAMASSLYMGLVPWVGPQLAAVSFAMPGMVAGDNFTSAWVNGFADRCGKLAAYLIGQKVDLKQLGIDPSSSLQDIINQVPADVGQQIQQFTQQISQEVGQVYQWAQANLQGLTQQYGDPSTWTSKTLDNAAKAYAAQANARLDSAYWGLVNLTHSQTLLNYVEGIEFELDDGTINGLGQVEAASQLTTLSQQMTSMVQKSGAFQYDPDNALMAPLLNAASVVSEYSKAAAAALQAKSVPISAVSVNAKTLSQTVQKVAPNLAPSSTLASLTLYTGGLTSVAGIWNQYQGKLASLGAPIAVTDAFRAAQAIALATGLPPPSADGQNLQAQSGWFALCPALGTTIQNAITAAVSLAMGQVLTGMNVASVKGAPDGAAFTLGCSVGTLPINVSAITSARSQVTTGPGLASFDAGLVLTLARALQLASLNECYFLLPGNDPVTHAMNVVPNMTGDGCTQTLLAQAQELDPLTVTNGLETAITALGTTPSLMGAETSATATKLDVPEVCVKLAHACLLDLPYGLTVATPERTNQVFSLLVQKNPVSASALKLVAGAAYPVSNQVANPAAIPLKMQSIQSAAASGDPKGQAAAQQLDRAKQALNRQAWVNHYARLMGVAA